MVRAIRTLKPLSGGFEVLTIGDRKMVRSVPKELDEDQSALLVLAQVRIVWLVCCPPNLVIKKTGYVDATTVQKQWGWTTARTTQALVKLIRVYRWN